MERIGYRLLRIKTLIDSDLMEGDFIKLKKAIAVIAGPFRLYQAIYLTYVFPEYKWDILLIAYGQKEEIKFKLESICKKSKRFANIYIAHTLTAFSGNGKLLIECIKMFGYFIIGKRKSYAEKVILDNIESFDYDMTCVGCSYSLMEGAILCFSSTKKTVVIEEGLDDYIKSNLHDGILKSIGARLLFKMQYINLLDDNFYAPLKYCEKYVQRPSLIRANHYQKINKMFDFSIIDEADFKKTIKEAFEIGDELFEVIIYTAPLWNYELEEKYIHLIQYVKNEFSGRKILLKRHPQDTYKYDFGNMNVVEKYEEIPGELVVRQWNNATHIFMFTSTILLGVEIESLSYKVVKFTSTNSTYNDLFDESAQFLDIKERNIIRF